MSAAMVKVILRQYGQEVKIKKYGEEKIETTKAFIQPFRFRDNKNIYGNYLEIGMENDGTYLYIGSAEIRLDVYPYGSSIKTAADSYTLKYAEKICIGEQIIYIRAILEKCS